MLASSAASSGLTSRFGGSLGISFSCSLRRAMASASADVEAELASFGAAELGLAAAALAGDVPPTLWGSCAASR